MRKRIRTTLTLPVDVIERLDYWADQSDRTRSSMASNLLGRTLADLDDGEAAMLASKAAPAIRVVDNTQKEDWEA